MLFSNFETFRFPCPAPIFLIIIMKVGRRYPPPPRRRHFNNTGEHDGVLNINFPRLVRN